MTASIGADFLEVILSGRRNTEAEWLAYFEQFHGEHPTANELFTLLTTLDRHTSYGLLARAAATAGGDAILDVGCGDGNLMDDLLEVCRPSARFAGVDICAPEIELAERRYHVEPRVSFVRANARALPFENGSFDLVLSHQFFNFLPDLGPVLAEAARVLKHHGNLVFAVNRGWRSNLAGNWTPVHDAASAALRKVYPHYVERPLIEDPRIYSDRGIREILAETGLFDIDTLSIVEATPRAEMTPDRVAAIYNRMYVFGSVPEKSTILEAVAERAAELAQDGVLEIEIPFRIVTIKRAKHLKLVVTS